MPESMTPRSFARAVHSTRDLLLRNKKHEPQAMRVEDKPWVTEHLLWMLAECLAFSDQDRPQKANRWLGYVQGCMACHGYKLDDLKRANMPEGDTFEGGKV